MTTRPQVFYKEDLCKALTGLTDSELRDRVSEQFVYHADCALANKPRTRAGSVDK